MKKVIFIIVFLIYIIDHSYGKELTISEFKNLKNIYGVWTVKDCGIMQSKKNKYFFKSLIKENDECKKYLNNKIIIEKQFLKTDFYIDSYFRHKNEDSMRVVDNPKYNYYQKYKEENYNINRYYTDFNILEEIVFEVKLYLDDSSDDYLDMKDICKNNFCYKDLLHYIVFDNEIRFVSYSVLFKSSNERVFIVLEKTE